MGAKRQGGEAGKRGPLGALQRRRAALGHRLGFAWKPAAGAGDYIRVFPFPRPWVVIGILAAFDAVFLFPAIGVFDQAVSGWSSVENLFSLTIALFLTAWLLGWCLAPLGMTVVLVVLLFGREVVTARRGLFELYLGLPLLGIALQYDPRHLRRLRHQFPLDKTAPGSKTASDSPSRKELGNSWRGPHAAIEYGEETVHFGIDVSELELQQMRASIEVATGLRIQDRDATPEELAELRAEWAGPEPRRHRPLVDPPDDRADVEPARPLTLSSPSVLVLIAANLIPLAGTAFFGWELSDVMVLYWAETAVVGLWNLARMWFIGRWLAIPAGIFFIGHFGGFMAVHFMFIWMIFVQGPAGYSGDAGGDGDLGEVAALFGALAPALLALFVSHGLSFFSNFLGRREFLDRKLSDQMGEPYGRVVFMHLVLIFGGGLALALGGPVPVIIGVIALKIVVDLRAHLKQHGSKAEHSP